MSYWFQTAKTNRIWRQTAKKIDIRDSVKQQLQQIVAKNYTRGLQAARASNLQSNNMQASNPQSQPIMRVLTPFNELSAYIQDNEQYDQAYVSELVKNTVLIGKDLLANTDDQNIIEALNLSLPHVMLLGKAVLDNQERQWVLMCLFVATNYMKRIGEKLTRYIEECDYPGAI